MGLDLPLRGSLVFWMLMRNILGLRSKPESPRPENVCVGGTSRDPKARGSSLCGTR